MRFDFLIPGLLSSPIAQRIREFAPALASLLARASVDKMDAESPESWIASRFGLTNNDRTFPFAAVASRAEPIGHSSDKYWLRADPVHLSVNRDRMVLLDASQLSITATECAALAVNLQEHFKNDDFSIHAPDPQRWYISSSQPISIHTHPISDVRGCNVADYWFDGPGRGLWQTRLSEMQMLLHADPVNEARDTDGRLPINGIWLWGAGDLPSALNHEYARVISNDVLLEGVASITAAQFLEASKFRWSAVSPKEDGNTLVELDELALPTAYGEWDAWQTSLSALDQNWFAPALAALKNGRLKEIKIYALSKKHSRVFSIKRIDLMKLWRHAQII